MNEITKAKILAMLDIIDEASTIIRKDTLEAAQARPPLVPLPAVPPPPVAVQAALPFTSLHKNGGSKRRGVKDARIPARQPDEPEWITVQDAKLMFGVSDTWIQNRIKTGQLRACINPNSHGEKRKRHYVSPQSLRMMLASGATALVHPVK